MRVQKLIRDLKFELNAALSRYHSSRGQFKKARACLDIAFSYRDDPPHYLLAHDANLMVQENRHEEARERYRMCLAMLPEILSSEEGYVSLYCKLKLGFYDKNCGYEELEKLWENAANLSVRGSPKHYLPIGSKSLLLQHYGNR